MHRVRERLALGATLDVELPKVPTPQHAIQLSEVFGSGSAESWEVRLLAVGVPAAQADRGDFLNNMLYEDHMQECGAAVEVAQDNLGDYWRAGPTMQFSAAPTPLDPAFLLGWATAAILGELGLDAQEIARLHDIGVTESIGQGLPG